MTATMLGEESVTSRNVWRSRIGPAVERRTDSIVNEYVKRLAEIRSPLLRPDVTEAVVANARSILRELVSGERTVDPFLSQRIGRARASSRVHPVDSIRAAMLLFETVLPVLGSELRAARCPEYLDDVVAELNDVVYGRVLSAATPYLDTLLRQVYESHHYERRRIARDLHDRTAHAIALAQQQLELRTLDLSRDDTERADQRLEVLSDVLVEAMEIVRELAGELGQSPTRDGFMPALQRYAQTASGPGIDVHVSGRGDFESIPVLIRDELYFVVREAIRNASAHSSSSRVSVVVELSDGAFEASIEDSGKGFDPAIVIEAERGAGSGLTSMRERMELLGGTLEISSSPARGTRVTAFALL